MKKSLIALVVALCSVGAVQARDQVVRDVTLLPKVAQTFLSKNFKSGVSFIKIEKTMGYLHEYEVVLTDGTEVNFNRDGSWDNVETPGDKSVPSQIVPKAITNYVSKNFPRQRIVSIDKERHGYDIELQSGLDLVFDKAGNFKRIDD